MHDYQWFSFLKWLKWQIFQQAAILRAVSHWIVTLALTGVVLLSVACGGGDTEDIVSPLPTVGPASTVAAPTTVPTQAPTEAPAKM